MELTDYIKSIGKGNHHLAMSDLKPLSGLNWSDRAAFWAGWTTIVQDRREQIARAMIDLAEDNVDLDFSEPLHWLLDDSVAQVRLSSVEGLWENDTPRMLRRLLELLQGDPSPEVRIAVAVSLSRFAYQAELAELDQSDAQALESDLLAMILDQHQPLDLRRRALESAGYFATNAEVQRQIQIAYESGDQSLAESALVAMGRSVLPRWLPIITKELSSPSPALRYEAARAAGEMAEGARALLPKVATLVGDQDNEVAVAAIWALGQIGGEAARRLLKQVSKSQDDVRRQAAVDALDELSLGEDVAGDWRAGKP